MSDTHNSECQAQYVTGRNLDIMMKGDATHERAGWREIVALPDFGIARLRAKIDTGARTSALHASDLENFERDGQPWVRFRLICEDGVNRLCEAPRVARRMITSSNGESQERLIVKTTLSMGTQVFRAEFSLADRSDMLFPMLVGRTALRRRFLVDSAKSFLLPEPVCTKETP